LKTKLIYLVFILLQSIALLLSEVSPNMHSTNIELRNNSVYIIGIMVEFQKEEVDDPRTTGDGTFLINTNIDSLVNCYNTQESRCNGFLIDPPPHNKLYFNDQIEATKNYYLNISNNNLNSFEYHVLDSVYRLDKLISEYSEISSYDAPEEGIALLYSDGLELASEDIENYISSQNLDIDQVLIVMFHAGVGEDYTFEGYLDPANYDIRSGYIEDSMLGLVSDESWMKQNNISKGILLPEGLNLIYYNTIEDIYGCAENMLCDTQIGMTGLFSYLLGYEFGLAEMFNRNNGKTGIGQFGLMDIGSFNLRGTLPSPPNPWSRLNLDWSQMETISSEANSFYSIKQRNTGDSSNSDSLIFKVNISNSEYYLIENIENRVVDDLSIEDIIYSDSLYLNPIPDSVISIFDRLLFIDNFNDIISFSNECNPDTKITISDQSGVILCSDNYDYGLPGRGLAIWHIDESNQPNMNDDIDNRTVRIIEADGAEDIGYPNYLYPIANPSTGWKWDLWFPENEAYFFVNDDQSNLNFNSYTKPSSMTNTNIRSFINIYDIDYLDNSTIMKFNLLPEQDLFISHSISDSSNFDIVGSGQYDNNGYLIIDNSDADEIQLVTSTATVSQGAQSPYEYDYFSVLDANFTLNFCSNDFYYSYSENQCVSLEDYQPMGYFNSSEALSTLPSWYSQSIIDYIAIGDIDLDGYDELIKLTNDSSNSNIECYNTNGVSCNNFPIEGEFSSNIIIADIINDLYPELIVRNAEMIEIISHKGEVLHSIPSEFSGSLYLIPNWGNYMNLVDGKRSLLFNQPSLLNAYWVNPGGLSNNEPIVNPLSTHNSDNSNEKSGITEFYNYPNPVVDNTTFRYYLESSENIKLKIYSASGFLIKTINPSFIYENDYNEINWDTSGLNAGVYIANLISYVDGKEDDSKITKVLLIND